MLNWNRVSYGELYIPCSAKSAEKAMELEHTVQEAFEGGYEKVKELPHDTIFLWMAKLLLGILYHDIEYSIDLGHRRRHPYKLSPLMTRKFTTLHHMLQSLVKPVRWTETPYSIVVKEVSYSQDVFNFKDETKNLNFSLGMNDFGIVACLQDRGFNKEYHHDLLQKMGDTKLHAIQFEELGARFIYSNFLMKQLSGWDCKQEGEAFVLSPTDPEEKPQFAHWEDRLYASVLEDYWKIWGLDPADIYTFPNAAMSFLINESTNQFIQPEEIPLPS